MQWRVKSRPRVSQLGQSLHAVPVSVCVFSLLGRSEVASDILESRKDFLAYILSLLRASHHEHGGVLPSLDLSAVEHLAWALDALYFLLKVSGN